MTQEVLKLALDALETELSIDWTNNDEFNASAEKMYKAIAAIKEALAQPAQDVAALVEGMEVSIDVSTGDHDSGNRLFGVVDLVQENHGSKHGLILLVQEPKANFKEALAQPEPVAWRTFDGEGGYDYRSYEDNESYAEDWNKKNPNHAGWVHKLYTHSQRTWVGLTRMELIKCGVLPYGMSYELYQAIEAKLKEKNCAG